MTSHSGIPYSACEQCGQSFVKNDFCLFITLGTESVCISTVLANGIRCLMCPNTNGSCTQKQDCSVQPGMDTCLELQYMDTNNQSGKMLTCWAKR